MKNIFKQFLILTCTINFNVYSMNQTLIAQNNEYHNHALWLLPNELINQFISPITPLENNIKAAFVLRRTCKAFSTRSIKYFGYADKSHGKKEKNERLKKLLWKMNDPAYWSMRCATSLLICAGADNNARTDYSLLEKAIHRKDNDMISLLFKHGASPNQKNHECPDFFAIETIEIAKIFDANGVNWNEKGDSHLYPNVLWSTILHHPSSELVQFYLEHKVDPKTISNFDNSCLLHDLISKENSYKIKNIADYVKIGKLLLQAAPEMVKHKNKYGQTPTDLAHKKIKGFGITDSIYQIYIELIELFETTEKQLEQDQK